MESRSAYDSPYSMSLSPVVDSRILEGRRLVAKLLAAGAGRGPVGSYSRGFLCAELQADRRPVLARLIV